MKNKKLIVLSLLLSFFFIKGNVYAINVNGNVACYEDTSDLGLYSSGGSYLEGLKCGQGVEIIGSIEVNNSCGYKYLLKTETNTGYATGCYITTTILSDFANNYYNTKESKDNYISKLKNEKRIPDSYIPYLLEIHARHPKWDFNANYIDIDWNTVINNENVNDRNLVYYTFNDNYRSTKYGYNWETDTFSRSIKEPNWYNVSEKALRFYMDPRNYLNQKYIFAFENLGYDGNNENAVNSILNGSFLPKLYTSFYNNSPSNDGSSGSCYTDVYNIGSSQKVSTTHLAARMIQEVGFNGGTASSGNAFNYQVDNNYYSASGYFNFFNIRAIADSYNSNVINGLIYAMGGVDKTNTTYFRPWNTPYKSILGGANFISGDYVSVGQSTLYYEKFAVVGTASRYSHQYQQNITAPLSEGGKAFTGYNSDTSLINNNFVFNIPVYNNMPNVAEKAPVLGNPNYYLNSLKVNGTSVQNFSYDKNKYFISVPVGTSSVNISASTINKNAKVSGVGTINLDSNNKDYNIIVTAGNGDTFTYTINIVREDDPKVSIETILNNSSVKYNNNYIFGINIGTNVSTLINKVKSITNYASISIKSESGSEKTNDSFRTGDTVSITSNGQTKKYTVALRGDVDGDGEITKLDYLAIMRNYYGYTTSSGAYREAADTNGDGVIDKLDYLAVLRDYYGYAKISQ